MNSETDFSKLATAITMSLLMKYRFYSCWTTSYQDLAGTTA